MTEGAREAPVVAGGDRPCGNGESGNAAAPTAPGRVREGCVCTRRGRTPRRGSVRQSAVRSLTSGQVRMPCEERASGDAAGRSGRTARHRGERGVPRDRGEAGRRRSADDRDGDGACGMAGDGGDGGDGRHRGDGRDGGGGDGGDGRDRGRRGPPCRESSRSHASTLGGGKANGPEAPGSSERRGRPAPVRGTGAPGPAAPGAECPADARPACPAWVCAVRRGTGQASGTGVRGPALPDRGA